MTLSDGTVTTSESLVGPAGSPGQPGNDGAPGQPGAQGVSVTNAMSTQAGRLVVTLSDGTTYTSDSLRRACTPGTLPDGTAPAKPLAGPEPTGLSTTR